jgi:hypothetical protein
MPVETSVKQLDVAAWAAMTPKMKVTARSTLAATSRKVVRDRASFNMVIILL